MRTTKPHPEFAPAGYQGFLQVVRYLHNSSLDQSLIHLIEVRASQLNGCVYCLDMHATAALEGGDSQRRVNLLAAWREAPCFTPRERAALAWTEALTELGRHGVDDALYEATRQHFSEQEVVDLTYAIAVINAWNRLGVGLLPDLPPAKAEVSA